MFKEKGDSGVTDLSVGAVLSLSATDPGQLTPYVVIQMQDLAIQMTPAEARVVGSAIFAAAESAIQDQALVTFLREAAHLNDIEAQSALRVLQGLREGMTFEDMRKKNNGSN
jgi:hypothetical protein